MTGLPAHTLIQRAGQAVARLARALTPHARSVWVACGPGNNGGDGLLAAAELHRLGLATGCRVTVTWLGQEDHLPDDSRHALAVARAAGVDFATEPPEAFDLAIDALLGLGARAAAQGRMADWVERLQRSPAPVLCVDLPSGLDPDSGRWLNDGPARPLGPRHTLALLSLKPGQFTGDGRDACGQLWFDDLEVDGGRVAPDAWLTADTAPRTPRQQRHGEHKGSHGELLVLGGQDVGVNGEGMTGAALLAARAGLQAGAGRVYLALLGNPGEGAPRWDPSWPELMFRSARSLLDSPLAGQATAVCGCGGGTAVREVLPALLQQSPRLVLDADALNALASTPAWQQQLTQRRARQQLTVLTPHPLEAARLLGSQTSDVQANRLGAATTLAERLQCVVVLKGSGTVVAAPGLIAGINFSGNALLATAGTGDVLAGLLGAYWAQGHAQASDKAGWEQAFEAATLAVWRHGRVADRWTGGTLTASGLVHALTPP